MAKKLFAVLLGFALAPAFIAAQDSVGTSIVGSTCLVRVYHTDFRFPPDGGRIVQIGNEMYFWKAYLPECANMLPSNQPVLVTSHAGSVSTSISGTAGPQIVGEPCAVRVYHSDFRFPPEGGKIVQLGNEMYFVRTYKPGCENVLNDATLLTASGNQYNPLQTSITTTAPTGPVYVNPSFTSVTGTNSNSQTVATTTTPRCY